MSTKRARMPGMAIPDPEKVEVLVKRLADALVAGETEEVSGPDALTAAMTFTYRLSRSVMVLTPRESKQENVDKIAHGLRQMAAMIEFDHAVTEREKVH